MKKKNKTYTVTQLNRMMMRDDLSLWEIIEACAFIDICSCYEPVFYPPKEQEDEWRDRDRYKKGRILGDFVLCHRV